MTMFSVDFNACELKALRGSREPVTQQMVVFCCDTPSRMSADVRIANPVRKMLP
ncbi:hypothetical protein [Neoroseomonas lacus]|uniref:hypothetical protein n=1 Tax=Neoroseomonas lacus TaxID=287609 RepID=UPI00166D7273|nr:hypothetical protein [Neoroseomonas lacus]